MTDLLLDDVSRFNDPWARWFHGTAVAARGLSHAEALEASARFSRDRSRSPMQWSPAPNAGFSPDGVTPWLPINPDHLDGVNVADQAVDPGSLLHFYRRLIGVRRRVAALRWGDCVLLDEGTDAYLAFLRRDELLHSTCLVVLNMSAASHRLRLDLPSDVLATALSSAPRHDRHERASDLVVEPYGIYIAELR
jgi:glycosidase